MAFISVFQMHYTPGLQDVQAEAILYTNTNQIHVSSMCFAFRFRGSLESNIVTVFAIRTERSVSTYRIPALSSVRARQQSGYSETGGHETAPDERRTSKDQTVKDSPETDGETGIDFKYGTYHFTAKLWLMFARQRKMCRTRR